MLDSLGVPAISAGDVTIYRLKPRALAMEQRAQQTRFEALVLGAERYLDGGEDLASLSVERAQQLGLMPRGWFGGTLAGSRDTNPVATARSLLESIFHIPRR
jgi:hypothetical protein